MSSADQAEQAQARAQATSCAALVDELIAHGVRHAVVAPGSRSTPMVLALADRPELAVHVVHDERAAAFVALGIGLAGVPAVVLCTSGTAAVNFHPAVVEAGLSDVPMIVVTADRPPELRDVGAPQAIDQTHLYGGAVRWFHDPGVPDAAAAPVWRSLGARAMDAAATGPVHLNLPFREPLVGEPDPLPPRRRIGVTAAPAPTADVPADVIALLRRPRGIVLAGAAGATHAELAPFVAATGWPLLADPVSGRRDVAGAVAAYDAILRHPGFAAEAPDVVVRVGRPATSKVLAQWVVGSGAPVVQIGGPGVIDPDHLVAARLASAALVPLRRALVGVGDRAWAAHWSEASSCAEAAIDRELGPEAPLSEPNIARLVATRRPPDSRLLVAASMPMRDLEWFGGVTASAHANRGANGIDGVVSTALGIALSTGAPTIAVVGDIAFVHDAAALTALARRDADLRIVVVDNDGGGIFSFLPQAATAAGAALRAAVRHAPRHRRRRPRRRSPPRRGHGDHARRPRRPPRLGGPVGDPRPHRSCRQRPGPRRAQRRGGCRHRRRVEPQGRISADSIAWNLAWVSASSASGSLSATMPPPAIRRARRPSARELGAAQRHRPGAVAGGVEPADGAGVAAALDPLDGGDERHRLGPRVATDGRRRRQRPHQLEHVRSRRRQHALDARAEVLDVGDGDDRRVGLPVEEAAPRQQRVVDDVDDDAVLDLVLGAVDEGGGDLGVAARRRRCAGRSRRAGGPVPPARRPRRAALGRRR